MQSHVFCVRNAVDENISTDQCVFCHSSEASEAVYINKKVSSDGQFQKVG